MKKTSNFHVVIFKVDSLKIKSEDHMILFHSLEEEALNVSNNFTTTEESPSSSFNNALKLTKKVPRRIVFYYITP